MNRQSKKRKGINYSKLRCPYCGSSVIYRSADGIYRDNPKHTMLYVCSRYPACDSYVRVHAGTKIPVTSVARLRCRSSSRIIRATRSAARPSCWSTPRITETPGRP